MENEEFRQWVVLELMGHRKLAGFLTEQEIAGKSFLRLDVHDVENDTVITQFYSADSVYCITPVTEEMANQVSKIYRPEPVNRFEFPALPQDQQENVFRELEC